MPNPADACGAVLRSVSGIDMELQNASISWPSLLTPIREMECQVDEPVTAEDAHHSDATFCSCEGRS